MSTKTQKKIKSSSSKSNVLKDIATAMANNQFGMGGASMSSLNPTIQQKIEDQQIIDETSEATGLERDKGLLKGNATDSEDVAQNLKDRNIAVKDEYKDKNSDVYNAVDFNVGDKVDIKTKKSDNDYNLEDVLKINDNDPIKVREWIRNHPKYEIGNKTQSWLDNNPISTSNDSSDEKNGNKKSMKDLKNENTDSMVAEGLDDSEVVENLGDESKKTADDLTKMNDEWVKSLNDSYSNIEDNYSENIPTYLWSMYKNGEFDGTTGDEKKDKKIGKERFGYLLLNQLGNNLVNASLIARGSAPSAESDLQKIRREKLEGGLERYNEKRKSTMNNLIEQIGLDGKLLAEYNMDVDKLATNQKFTRMAKALDRKDMERTLKAYKFAGDYLANVPDEEKSNIFLTIMALNSNDGTSAGITYLTSVLGKPATDKILGFLKDK